MELVTEEQSSPEVRHILLCDHALSDSQGKNSYIGAFTELYSKKFPGGVVRFFICCDVLNLPDQETVIAMQIVAVEGPSWTYNVAQATVRILDDKPLPKGVQKSLGLNVEVANLSFPRPGAYEVQVSVDKAVIGTRQFAVVERP